MAHQRSRSPIVALLVALSAACATHAGIKSEALDVGIIRVYPAAFDRVLAVSREAVVEAGLKLEEAAKVDDRTWIIIGRAPTSFWSWGELVRVVVEKTNDAETTVRVLTKRRVATNVTAKGDYSTSILSNIDLKLR